MLFSKALALVLGSFIFTAVAAPTPSSDSASRVEKRQSDRQILLTLPPNYLVLLNESQPNTIYGSQYIGSVSWTPGRSNEWTAIVGWDVPVVKGANECYLRFALPPIKNSFSWASTGAGIMEFYQISRPVVPANDSWNHKPIRLTKQGTVIVHGGVNGGEATLTGQYLDCDSLIAMRRLDFEFVAAHVGYVQNLVETFQRGPTDHQGWFLEFSL